MTTSANCPDFPKKLVIKCRLFQFNLRHNDLLIDYHETPWQHFERLDKKYKQPFCKQFLKAHCRFQPQISPWGKFPQLAHAIMCRNSSSRSSLHDSKHQKRIKISKKKRKWDWKLVFVAERCDFVVTNCPLLGKKCFNIFHSKGIDFLSNSRCQKYCFPS